jgi:divalent metal cation (Fe/Co/Zn/Cd) transporter
MKLEERPPTKRFPYGYYRVVSVGFLVAAASLSIIGLWLLYDSLTVLVRRERPPIGTMHLFGHTFWLGWAMVAALAYSVVVGFSLGTVKRPVARAVNDRVLEADADMNRADWMAEGAAIVGVLMVGFGHWWGDAAAAGLISLSIIRDGWLNLKQVIADLMDESPSKVGGDEMESLPRRIEQAAERLPWVERAAVRLREQGHLITGSVFVVPNSPPELLRQTEEAATALMQMDWRLHGLTVVPTTSLEDWGPPRQQGKASSE